MNINHHRLGRHIMRETIMSGILKDHPTEENVDKSAI